LLVYVIFIVSLAVLIYGADLIVGESEKIALKFGISEYVIGATLVALGTSLPEMAASINASINSKPELSISNIVGSNIINISLVLGIIIVLAKGEIKASNFLQKDSAWALFPVLMFIIIILNGEINRFNGFILILIMIAYVIFLLRNNKDALDAPDNAEESLEKFNWAKTSILLILGFVMVVYGADFTIDSAAKIAKSFGVSDWVVGVILVALGTSMPELVVSISATLQGKANMAIGNIIGSNVANISIALGAAAVANPIKLDFYKYLFDITTMLIVTLILVFVNTNRMYSRAVGIILLLIFTVFIEHSSHAIL